MARSSTQLIKAMAKAKEKLAKVRDELRDIEEEAETLVSVSSDAVESLEYAIDVLSQHV